MLATVMIKWLRCHNYNDGNDDGEDYTDCYDDEEDCDGSFDDKRGLS